ncbi:MAG: LysR family transcriptional regulator [Planctomycetota bacterium]|nr:LysR family transcriptional regulator [Planctomycetota bacterium]MDA1178187.1 LysR family transcriptional regulator [Planctomycetota bacterium]
MQFRSLKVFCDVIDQRSFSLAARENGLSQSSASQLVHQLEGRLGVRLIDRSQRPLTVTREGEVFYEGCQRLLRRYRDLERRVRRVRSSGEGHVSIAAIYSIGLSHLNACIKAFLGRHPEAKVRVQYQQPDRVYQLVESRQVDLGLVSYPRSSRKVEAMEWRTEPMVLVCSPHHALCLKPAVVWQDLHGLPMVGFSEELRIRREIDRTLTRCGVEPLVAMEFDNIETIKRAIEIDAGVGLLPLPTIEREVQAGTLASRVISDGELTRPLGIIRRRDAQLSRTAQGVVDLLQQHADPAKGETGGSNPAKSPFSFEPIASRLSDSIVATAATSITPDCSKAAAP